MIGSKFSKNIREIRFSDYLEYGAKNLPGFASDDVYIHMAGIVGERAVSSDVSRAGWVNVESLPGFLSALRNQGLHRFVYVSSSHVYSPTKRVITEESALGPFSEYGLQKLRAENLLASVAPSLGINLRILRVFSILGPGMPPESLYGAAHRAADGIETLRFALDVRDFLTPEECAQLIERASCLEAESEVEIFNLCSGVGKTVRDAVSALMADEGKVLHDDQLDLSNSEVPSIRGDCTKLFNRLQVLRCQRE